jgi:hypothetical protein
MANTGYAHVTAFSGFNLAPGCLYDYSGNQFPTILYAWQVEELVLPNKAHTDTFFGYVHEGPVHLVAEHNQYDLVTGQYFALAESISLQGGTGIVVKCLGYRGQNMIGGPIEQIGRLRYIDGCTDSLLIPPVRLGDPCLNALYFPPNVNQTAHTHPSMRVGMVTCGGGECLTLNSGERLFAGKVFIIHPDGIHSFRTNSESGMVVIAYHPDSDFGPKDFDHPMINRTMINGASAADYAG